MTCARVVAGKNSRNAAYTDWLAFKRLMKIARFNRLNKSKDAFFLDGRHGFIKG